METIVLLLNDYQMCLCSFIFLKGALNSNESKFYRLFASLLKMDSAIHFIEEENISYKTCFQSTKRI